MSNGDQQYSMAGKPATICPRCGCAMFANGTQTLKTIIFRYVNCRNCGRSYRTKQTPPVIMYEVKQNGDSSSGRMQLSVAFKHA